MKYLLSHLQAFLNKPVEPIKRRVLTTTSKFSTPYPNNFPQEIPNPNFNPAPMMQPMGNQMQIPNVYINPPQANIQNYPMSQHGVPGYAPPQYQENKNMN